MKTVTVRLPETLVADIEAESRERNVSMSNVVRERLQVSRKNRRKAAGFAMIGDLIGSVKTLPSDLSGNKKAYLRATGYGRNRSR